MDIFIVSSDVFERYAYRKDNKYHYESMNTHEKDYREQLSVIINKDIEFNRIFDRSRCMFHATKLSPVLIEDYTLPKLSYYPYKKYCQRDKY